MKPSFVLILALILVATCFVSAVTRAGAQPQSFDATDFYKRECLGCHGSKSQKKFNPDAPEAQMIDAILHGLVMETPPDMPAFTEKGINEEKAKALISYMKSIHEDASSTTVSLPIDPANRSMKSGLLK